MSALSSPHLIPFYLITPSTSTYWWFKNVWSYTSTPPPPKKNMEQKGKTLPFWIWSSEYLGKGTNYENSQHNFSYHSSNSCLLRLLFSAAPSSKSVLTYRIMDEQIFQNFGSHLKILGASKVTWNKFHTENPQMLGATAQNSVTWVTCSSGFVHPCTIYSSSNVRNKVSCTHKTK